MEVEEGQPLFFVKRGEDLKVSILSYAYTLLISILGSFPLSNCSIASGLLYP